LLCYFFGFFSLSSGRGVVLLEGRHEVEKGLDTLHSHGVVEAGTDSTDRTMSLEVEQVGSRGLGDELGLEGVVRAHAERNVDTGAVLRLDVADVVAGTVVDVVVEHLTALLCLGLHDGDTALLDHVCEVEAAHIDGPAWWGVLERVRRLREQLPVTHHRGIGTVAGDQIVPDDANERTSGTHVLLCARVDHAVLAPVDWLRQEVARHIADEMLALRHQVEGEILTELKALNRLIIAVVEEFGIGVDVPCGRVSHGGVARVFIVSALDSVAIFVRFLDGALRPCARGDVIGRLALSVFEEVVADG